MTLALAAGDTISGIAGSATSITYTISGDEITSSGDAFKVLAQGQLGSSAGTLYTVPSSTSAVVKSIHLANPTASAVTAKLTVKGTAAANVILPAISIVAGGFAVFGSDGWVFYNSSGQRLGEGAKGDTGAAGADGADGDMTNPMTTAGDVIYGGASGSPTRLGIGTASQVLTVNAGATAPEWAASASGFSNPMTTAGDIITGGSSGAAQRLAKGTDDQVLTMVSGSVAWADAASGSGGLTQAYAGYNTVGGTSVAPTDYDHVLQKITLANDCLLASIDLYIKNNSAGQAGNFDVLLYDDVSGKPVHWLGGGVAADAQRNFVLYRVSSTPGDARWVIVPVGAWLTAGDYWIGFHWTGQGAQHLVYYDATGTGYKWAAGGNSFITDAPDTSGTVYALTSQTRTYSVRASTIR